MRRRTFWTGCTPALVAGALLLAGAPALAQSPRHITAYCSSGPERNCYTIGYNSGGNVEGWLRFRNLQGVPGTTGNPVNVTALTVFYAGGGFPSPMFFDLGQILGPGCFHANDAMWWLGNGCMLQENEATIDPETGFEYVRIRSDVSGGVFGCALTDAARDTHDFVLATCFDGDVTSPLELWFDGAIVYQDPETGEILQSSEMPEDIFGYRIEWDGGSCAIRGARSEIAPGALGPECRPRPFLLSRDGISTVPEPGTYALLGTGLVGLGAIRRRTRRPDR